MDKFAIRFFAAYGTVAAATFFLAKKLSQKTIKHRKEHNKEHNSEVIQRLRSKSEKAMKTLNADEYDYALQDVRQIFEEALHIVVNTTVIDSNGHESLSENLKTVKEMDLLDSSEEFYQKLYEVKRLCNQAIHASVNDEPLTHEQVYFCIMTINKLIDVVEEQVI